MEVVFVVMSAKGRTGCIGDTAHFVFNMMNGQAVIPPFYAKDKVIKGRVFCEGCKDLPVNVILTIFWISVKFYQMTPIMVVVGYEMDLIVDMVCDTDAVKVNLYLGCWKEIYQGGRWSGCIVKKF